MKMIEVTKIANSVKVQIVKRILSTEICNEKLSDLKNYELI